MSYYSEVGVKIYSPVGYTADKIWEAYTKAVVAKGGSAAFVEKLFTKHIVGNMLVLHVDGVKWYDGDPCVEGMREILNGIQELSEELGGGYHFMRIGEQYDDVEEHICGDVDNYINCVRYIDLNMEGDFDARIC